MKDAEYHLGTALAESLTALLGGLSEKHTCKLQKIVAVARKLARRHRKLLAKGPRKDRNPAPPVLGLVASQPPVGAPGRCWLPWTPTELSGAKLRWHGREIPKPSQPPP